MLSTGARAGPGEGRCRDEREAGPRPPSAAPSWVQTTHERRTGRKLKVSRLQDVPTGRDLQIWRPWRKCFKKHFFRRSRNLDTQLGLCFLCQDAETFTNASRGRSRREERFSGPAGPGTSPAAKARVFSQEGAVQGSADGASGAQKLLSGSDCQQLKSSHMARGSRALAERLGFAHAEWGQWAGLVCFFALLRLPPPQVLAGLSLQQKLHGGATLTHRPVTAEWAEPSGMQRLRPSWVPAGRRGPPHREASTSQTLTGSFHASSH